MSNIDHDKIFFLSRFKEELYNTNMQYKITLSDYVYYEKKITTDYNILNVFGAHNFTEKNNILNYLINENERTINNINCVLNEICPHEWITDEIESGLEGLLQKITYCNICSLKKGE